MRLLSSLVLVLAVAWQGGAGPSDKSALSYSAAFVDHRQQLHVFPDAGAEFEIALGIVPLAYGPDGESVYGHSSDPFGSGLLRVSLNPIASKAVPYTDALRIGALAVSRREDEIVISGSNPLKDPSACGLFDLKLATGMVRQIAMNSTCDYPRSWVRLSLSPDGKRIVAYRKPRLEMIDIETGTIQPLAGDYIAGAWSPDGRWLAVLGGDAKHRTTLLDSTSLREVRVLGETNVMWSPDSRFLLGASTASCSPYWSSLFAIEVPSGKETVFESSRCKVNLNTLGWVSGGVRR